FFFLLAKFAEGVSVVSTSVRAALTPERRQDFKRGSPVVVGQDLGFGLSAPSVYSDREKDPQQAAHGDSNVPGHAKRAATARARRAPDGRPSIAASLAEAAEGELSGRRAAHPCRRAKAPCQQLAAVRSVRAA
ncbi:unnamed protein product, partial [Ixodes persulcatus]